MAYTEEEVKAMAAEVRERDGRESFFFLYRSARLPTAALCFALPCALAHTLPPTHPHLQCCQVGDAKGVVAPTIRHH